MTDSKENSYLLFLSEAIDQINEANDWYGSLETAPITGLIPSAQGAEHTAIFCADMIYDFCKPGGALYSDRIEAIIKPIVKLFNDTYKAGVRTFILMQDYHSKDAEEFRAFSSHALIGTDGAKTICELMELPFASEFITFCKNTTTPAFSRRQLLIAGRIPSFREKFEDFLKARDIKTVIVVGDCTDESLCAGGLALYLKFWANQNDREMNVVIPENCVATFHIPLDIADNLGIKPHPGDFYHRLALYEMARHKIIVVKEIL